MIACEAGIAYDALGVDEPKNLECFYEDYDEELNYSPVTIVLPYRLVTNPADITAHACLAMVKGAKLIKTDLYKVYAALKALRERTAMHYVPDLRI